MSFRSLLYYYILVCRTVSDMQKLVDIDVDRWYITDTDIDDIELVNIDKWFTYLYRYIDRNTHISVCICCWIHGGMSGWTNKSVDPTHCPGLQKKKATWLSLLPCRSSLMCGRGDQTRKRVRIKWEEWIRESSKSGGDEKGWVWERFFGPVCLDEDRRWGKMNLHY